MQSNHLLLGSVLACLLLSGCVFVVERHVTPQHIYTIHPAPAFLTEELALEKARETLARDGYDLENWQLKRTDSPKRKAPDGRRDKYLERFTFRSHAGHVHFGKGTATRTYHVWLDGDRVTCAYVRPGL
jgi:hypothetical protein